VPVEKLTFHTRAAALVSGAMKRHEFRKLFKTVGPAVLPVIHVQNERQAESNVRILIGEGAAGCFLINHDFGVERFLPIVAHVRERFPALWMGVNFLGVTGKDAFPVLGKLQREGIAVDGYWADDARIDERLGPDEQAEASEIAAARSQSRWSGLYTGGTCFKKQRPVAPEHNEVSARLAAPFMDAVCTSGMATGHAVDEDKIAAFRRGLSDHALTLASGITPENAHLYLETVDGFLVATGINRDGDFYNLAPAKLGRLLKLTREHGARS
jgi:hypothetical protein